MKRFSDKYEVIAEIGQGTEGAVYKARHTALETIVAIKVLSEQTRKDQDHVKRSYQQAREMARLQHPNIAKVIDVQHDNELDMHYFIMEFIQGQNLRELAQKKGTLESTQLLELARQIAMALDYAHKSEPPVVHCALKPSNIMIEDCTNRVVVMDFGVVREFDVSDLTQVSAQQESLKYMAPEQIRNEPVNAAADVYALGTILYEVYTGGHMFNGVSEKSLSWKIANQDEYNIQAFPLHTPPCLQAILNKCIKKDLNLRYRGMDELLLDINQCLQSLSVKMPRKEPDRRQIVQLREQDDLDRRYTLPHDVAQLAADPYRQASDRRGIAIACQSAEEFPKAIEFDDPLSVQAGESIMAEQVKKAFYKTRTGIALVRKNDELGNEWNREAKAYSPFTPQAETEVLKESQSFGEAFDILKQARSSMEEADEKLLEKVSSLRHDAELGQLELENLGLLQPNDYEKALELHHRADYFLNEARLEEAAEYYKKAAWEYGQALEESVRLYRLNKLQSNREQINQLRSSVLAAKHEVFIDQLEKLENHRAEVLRLEQELDMDAAVKLSETAVLDWKQLLLDVQNHNERAAAEQAMGRLNAAKAGNSTLRNWAKIFWEKADKQTAELNRTWQLYDYVQIPAKVDDILQTYADARIAAEIQQEAEQRRSQFEKRDELGSEQTEAKAAAETAWQTATTARQAALHIAEDGSLSEDFAEAEALLKQADIALSAEDFTQAGELFIRSAEQYEQLTEQMAFNKSEQLRSEVFALREKIPDHASLAKRQQAEKMLAQAEILLESGDYPEAIKSFKSALSRFTKLLETKEVSLKPVKTTPSLTIYLRSAAGALAAIGFVVSYIYFSADNKQKPEDVASASQLTKTPAPGPNAEPQVKKTQAVLEQTPVAITEPVEPATRPSAFSFTPANQQIDIAEGQVRKFAVQADNAKSLDLHYVWFVNDQKQSADTAEWQYRAGFADAADKPKQLKVVVNDGAKPLETKTWQIQVSNVNREPKLLSFLPVKDKLELAAGEIANFSAIGSDPDADDKLSYKWLLDGKPIAKKSDWTFKPTVAAEHNIAVEISDTGGLKVGKTWNVQVTPAKAIDAPPRITSVSPEITGKPLLINTAGKQLFTAKATDGSAIHYSWYLDGKKSGESSEWTYKPNGTEVEGAVKEVKLVVADSNGKSSETVWKVKLEHSNHPPRIERSSPKVGESIKLSKDGSQSFSVKVNDPDRNDKLSYAWQYDGVKVGMDSSWELKTPSEGNHKVELKVTDSTGLTAERIWNVRVEADESLRLDLVDARPAQNQIAAEADEPLNFTVKADLSGKKAAGKDLHYEWTVDNAPPKQTFNGEFSLKIKTPGKHDLSVNAVYLNGLYSSSKSWQVEIKPKKVEPPKPLLVENNPVVESKSVSETKVKEADFKEAEVKAWLQKYQNAWQGRDVNSLIGLGEVEPRNAEKLKDVFQQYDAFEVSLQDVEIRIEGNQAKVSFERIDTINGKAMPQPGRKKLVLEKRADGFVHRQ